jgi:hypothetical protein
MDWKLISASRRIAACFSPSPITHSFSQFILAFSHSPFLFVPAGLLSFFYGFLLAAVAGITFTASEPKTNAFGIFKPRTRRQPSSISAVFYIFVTGAPLPRKHHRDYKLRPSSTISFGPEFLRMSSLNAFLMIAASG